jgi:putative FmdB family regulatory protein
MDTTGLAASGRPVRSTHGARGGLTAGGQRARRRHYRARRAPAAYNFVFCIKGLHKGSAMPIYAYRCGACGHEKDILQKVSDAPLTTCPACGAEAFSKQLTAAGFQLKGSGWYATDFKGSGAKPAADPAKPASAPDAGSGSTSGDKPAASPAGGGTAATGGCGASCACH